MRKPFNAALILLQLLLGAALLASAGTASAQRGEEEDDEESAPTATARLQVMERLGQFEECMEMEDYACAREQLERIRSIRDLNAYELAQLWYYYAYVELTEENFPEAIVAYERVLEQPELPYALATQTMLILAQLYVVEERYEEGLEMMDQWFMYAEDPGPDQYVFKAQIHYLMQQYEEGIPPVLTALDIAAERQQPPQEGWYQLLNFFYYELENFPKVIETLHVLANQWPKKDYFVQLAGMYGERGDDAKMLALYEAAYEAGWLTRSNERVTLAQMYLQAEVPYKAARLLEEGLDEGAIEEDETVWRLVSQAWQLAQEDERALPALSQASRLADTGELDVRLAQSYANLARWQDCVDASRSGVNRGGLDRPDDARLLLGNCLVRLRRWNDATEVFQALARNAETENYRSRANEFLEYIVYEVERERQLEAAKREAAGEVVEDEVVEDDAQVSLVQ